jgi:hypothetical protein
VSAAPVWLLDVDGVLNVARPGWSEAPHRGEALADGAWWPMRWAPALIQRIARLHASGLAEVRWCSTWCPWADQLETLFGLPRLAAALTTEEATSPGLPRAAAKAAAAFRVLDAEGRRLIWTDDDAIPHGEARLTLTAGGRSLLIEPDSARGLQPADLDEIEAWI